MPLLRFRVRLRACVRVAANVVDLAPRGFELIPHGLKVAACNVAVPFRGRQCRCDARRSFARSDCVCSSDSCATASSRRTAAASRFAASTARRSSFNAASACFSASFAPSITWRSAADSTCSASSAAVNSFRAAAAACCPAVCASSTACRAVASASFVAMRASSRIRTRSSHAAQDRRAPFRGPTIDLPSRRASLQLPWALPAAVRYSSRNDLI